MMHFIRRTKDKNREERLACQSKNKGVWGYNVVNLSHSYSFLHSRKKFKKFNKNT